ncbi:hypothetical protein A9797_18595 (plasmid) [Edwardsiella piscicida]|uniref:hypothetical protein n=1 Tax=Edwardsiella piscicida TaxID=1263550 RepID=UPI000900BC0D|nr:hypothetical protein [Edwardsiella piscicida]EKS7785097.1 hypothetical protein [Edwardsiella piscicida]UBU80063.1 hypothetical protein A9797_18595 [Edwardsiella piscicida]UCQ33042.1 hypothetical protein DCF74_18185 [Edwardsiella piscicida]
MKSRDLKTIHDLIVTNYKKHSLGNGRYLHTFQPATTDTTYQFEANSENELVPGERYNIGFTEVDGLKIVDISCVSKSSVINKYISYECAKMVAKEKHDENKGKNDSRVNYTKQDDYYWGKKYAWREFGLVIPKGVFFSYLLDCVKHPYISCTVTTPGYPTGDDSIAFAEKGLEKAIEDLINSATMIKNGPYFTSPLYFDGKNRFSIRGINAITDKK